MSDLDISVSAENKFNLIHDEESQDEWNVLMAAFLDSQDIMESSRDMYFWALTRYFRWLNRTFRTLKGLTPADVMVFKNHLVKSGLSAMTISAYITAIRQFYRWTESNLLYPNIARSVKPPRGKKGFRKMHLTEQESCRLLEFARSRSVRDYAIINLILRTGLRTIEVSRADVCDVIHKRGRRILRVCGKGMDEKNDFVILGDKVWHPINEYLVTRSRVARNEPLFVTEGKGHRGERMSTRLI